MHFTTQHAWDVIHILPHFHVTVTVAARKATRYADAKCWSEGEGYHLSTWQYKILKKSSRPCALQSDVTGVVTCDARRITICVWLGLEQKVARAWKGLFHYTSNCAILSIKHLCNQASAEALSMTQQYVITGTMFVTHQITIHTYTHELQALVPILCVAQTTLHHSNAINVQVKSQPRSCASQRLSIDSAWVLVPRRWAGINDSLQEQPVLLLELIDLLL